MSTSRNDLHQLEELERTLREQTKAIADGLVETAKRQGQELIQHLESELRTRAATLEILKRGWADVMSAADAVGIVEVEFNGPDGAPYLVNMEGRFDVAGSSRHYLYGGSHFVKLNNLTPTKKYRLVVLAIPEGK